MKYFINISFFLFLWTNVLGQINNQQVLWETETLSDTNLQKQEYIDTLQSFDIGRLWTHTNNTAVVGFIGNHYQRIRIKILTARKNHNSPNTYFITGKCMVKNIISSFSGTIKIFTARIYKNINLGVDSEYFNKGIKDEGLLLAKYHFLEGDNHHYSGIFSGLLTTYWYIDKKEKIRYDDIEGYADGYCNNQYVGIWQGYHSNQTRICNWGDYRIPFSDSLDIGAGEFSPDDQYLKYGWNSYREAYFNNNKMAIRKEARKWWK